MDPEDKDSYEVMAEVMSGEKIIVNRNLSREEAIREVQRLAGEF